MRRSLIIAVSALLSTSVVAQQLPHPDHIVIVIEENKDFGDIIGSANASYINSLVTRGALLTNSHALHHPSQPNYLELFSGSTQGVCNDRCPFSPTAAPNLARSLIDKGLTFTGYAESLPTPPTKCQITNVYGRKHCPWIDFTNVPPTATQDFSRFPTTAAGFAMLPHVAFVIPDLTHDMHNLPGGGHNRAQEVRNGDKWLRDHLGAYVDWAMTHNSLLIVTWDEDHQTVFPPNNECEHPVDTHPPRNHIATIVVGEHVIPHGTSAMTVTHDNVLRTIEDIFGLPAIGGSSGASPITGIWQ